MHFSSSPNFQLIYIHFITIIIREECILWSSAACNSLHPFFTCIFLTHDLLFSLFLKTLNSPLLSYCLEIKRTEIESLNVHLLFYCTVIKLGIKT